MTRRDELHNVLDRHRRRPGRRVRSGQDQHRRRARRQRRRDRRRSPRSAASTASRCGSSSSCRSTRPTPGSAPRSSARTRSSRRSPPSGRSSRCRRAARRPPIAGAISTASGTVGVIPTVTKPFCGDCDRVRLTADGQFRTCLFATDEFDLRELLRNGEFGCRYRGMHRGGGRHQVGRAPDQPGQLHPSRAQHEPDRRVSRRPAGVAVLVGALAIGSAAGAAVTTIDRAGHGLRDLPIASRRGARSSAGARSFPADNAWNQDISQAPLHPNSAAIIASIQSNGGTRLHPDFGENPDYGIPFVVVPGGQPLVPITYTAYGDESDPGPFPIPLDAPVEGGAGVDRRPPRARACAPTRATCSSSTARSRPGRDGGPTAAPASTCAPTRCGRSAGRAPTPPACRSCPGSCATRRWRRGRSGTRSG